MISICFVRSARSSWVKWWCATTGSSRKNVKSKMVCTGVHFHKSWVFSAVSDPELATNLSSTAPRSTTITRRHPKKLIYLKCFLALVDCLRPTTAPPHLSKDPHCVLLLVRTKISRMNTYMFFFTANFAPHIPKNSFWGFAQSLRVSSWPQEANQSLEAHWRHKLLWMTLVDCGGPGYCTG